MSLLAAVGFLLPVISHAQVRPTREFSQMWAVKTNIFEWVILVPNIGVEFDLSPSVYNHSTLSLSAKYNWNTYHRLAPSKVFDMLDIRPEYRYYTHDPIWKNGSTRTAKYLGAYASYARYSFLLGKKGIQGSSAGAGVSAGIVLPMYRFSKVALDLELGASVGLQAADYDIYSHHTDGFYYTVDGARPWHVTPFPVVSELRAAIALRQCPALDKYIKTDPDLISFRRDRVDAGRQFEEKGRVNRVFFDDMFREKADAYAASDSLYRADFRSFVAAECSDMKQRVDNPNHGYARRLQNYIDRRGRKTMRRFDAYLLQQGRAVVRPKPASRQKQPKQAKLKVKND